MEPIFDSPIQARRAEAPADLGQLRDPVACLGLHLDADIAAGFNFQQGAHIFLGRQLLQIVQRRHDHSTTGLQRYVPLVHGLAYIRFCMAIVFGLGNGEELLCGLVQRWFIVLDRREIIHALRNDCLGNYYLTAHRVDSHDRPL